MGKAFSEEERQEVQEKLRRIGLRLLAEDGIKNISIRQLTSEAGIAQGGFYTFYQDKDDFVEDLFLLRIKKKTDAMYKKERRHLMIRKVLSQVLSITKVCTLNRIRHLLTVKAILYSFTKIIKIKKAETCIVLF